MKKPMPQSASKARRNTQTELARARKKIEALERQAQIEAALERVRARTMAMQDSSELAEAATVLSKQLKALGLLSANARAYFSIYDTKTDSTEVWTTQEDGVLRPGSHRVPLTENPSAKKAYDAWKAKESFFVRKLSGKALTDYLKFLSSLEHIGDDQELKQLVITPPELLVLSEVFFANGAVGIISLTPLTQEAQNILRRFARIFEQTYTRFLDLKKSEAQAREAQIEAALERVRARTMAMHESHELADAAKLLFQQVEGLGIKAWACGFNIWDEKDAAVLAWMSSPQGDIQPPFKLLHSEHPMLQRFYAARSKEEQLYVEALGGETLADFQQYLMNLPEFQAMVDNTRKAGFALPEFQVYHCAYFSRGYLLFITLEQYPEAWDIFKRFARLFEQTYTRFLDLQKAEAQAREAQIEAALERIRSRALGMRHSSEVGNVTDLFFSELENIGIKVVGCSINALDKTGTRFEHWRAKQVAVLKGFESYSYREMIEQLRQHVPEFTTAFEAAWKSGKPFYKYRFAGEERELFFTALSKLYQYSAEQKQEMMNAYPDPFGYQTVFFEKGFLRLTTTDLLAEADLLLCHRFTEVFDFAYTRFLDLKQAEEQAREAQIEAALERVRTKAMAMHKSDDLNPAVATVFEELDKLRLGVSRCGIGILDREKRSAEVWTTSKSEHGSAVHVSGDESMDIHPLLQGAFDAWLKQGDFSYVLEGEDLADYYRALGETNFRLPESQSMVERAEWLRQYYYVASFEAGGLFAFRETAFPEEAKTVMKRFAGVFNLTYKRFLDIQKAEAQVREAQIETALERVRARAMAMHHSQELKDVALELRNQMGLLGQKDLEVCAIHLYEGDDNYFESWGAIRAPNEDGKLFQGQAKFPKSGIKIVDEMMQHYIAGSKDYVLVNEGEKGAEWLNVMKEYAPEAYAAIANTIENTPPEELRAYWSIADFSGGALVMVTYSRPDENSRYLLRRCANVFDLAYTRFLDLQKAEAHARDATQQASLDRVRAEIASMRNAADLQRITPLIWRELTTLGVPFFRCGVFIIEETTERAHVYLSTPSGEAVAALHLKFDSAPVVKAAVQHWRQQQVYREEWNREQFIAWTQSILEQGLIDSPEKYQGGEAPEKLVLQFVPFTQGMLYIGSSAALSDDEIEIGHALAKAFGVAYARYEDFQRLEAAKREVEVTLDDLKKTQSQLVQAEKMASLGQLTAGIAHEIKNPLNFVNNFAALSVDLAKELREEIAKIEDSGSKIVDRESLANVDELVGNLIQNAEKINHHGKRADGIVKSMMQHARGGKGDRQPTDVNALVEEYINLTYHGMRARVPDFNVSIERDLGELVGKIEMVPQDIGRVLLNLLGNAFDAVRERAQSADGTYAPRVSIATRAVDGGVEIRVSDNGGGIPDEVREKIFEPFFTTKPAGSGTGLGLSLSYDIITQGHGGALTVENTEGEGATFIITLPAK